METRCTELARALDNDSLGALVMVLAQRNSVAVDLVKDARNGIGPLSDIKEAAPAWHEFIGRCQNGWREGLEREATQQAADLAKAKEILGDRWQDGPVDAREWMAVIIGEPEAGKYAPVVLREWCAYVGAQDYLRDMERAERMTIAKPSDAAREARREEVRRFIKDYAIGTPPPKSIKAILEANFSECWPEAKLFDIEDQKVRGVLQWHPFWQQHGPAYAAAHEEAADLAKAVSKVKSTSGKTGVGNRERNRYLLFTQEFLATTAQQKITKEIIESYPKQDGVTEEKGREFLNTLLTASGNIGSHKAMSETLAVVGIKLLQEHAEECFSVLFDRKIPEQ